MKRNARNNASESKMRTFVRKAQEAIQGGNRLEAEKAFTVAMSELHRCVSKGVMKKNTASRKISRLNNALRVIVKN